MRLKSHIWVSAYLRRLDTLFLPGALVRRGDADAGAIYIKLTRFDGLTQVLAPAPAYLLDGEKDSTLIMDEGRAWTPVFPSLVSEADADAYLSRQTAQDGDSWILEVESADGRHYLGETSLALS